MERTCWCPRIRRGRLEGRIAVGSTRIRESVVTVLVLAVGLVVSTSGVAEAKTEPDRHCVVEVVDVDRDMLVTGPETCFGSRAEAQSHASSNASRSSGGVVGTHYTATNYGGSSITITGSSCNGGTWTPSGAWNNNIESSEHLCGGLSTTFYDSANCVTNAYPINSSRSTLGSMNNKASCVRYG